MFLLKSGAAMAVPAAPMPPPLLHQTHTTDTSLYRVHQSCVDIEVWHYHFINEISTSYIYNLCKRLPTGNDPCNINNSVHPLKDKTGLHCLQGEYMCEGDREREQALQKFWEI